MLQDQDSHIKQLETAAQEIQNQLSGADVTKQEHAQALQMVGIRQAMLGSLVQG